MKLQQPEPYTSPLKAWWDKNVQVLIDGAEKPANSKLAMLPNRTNASPSKYDVVDFEFIHDGGFAIIAKTPVSGGVSECEVNEDFTIGEALDELDNFIKKADLEHEFYLVPSERR